MDNSDFMDDVVAQLLTDPVRLEPAAGPDGVPASPGLYAWWVPTGAVPGIAGPPHPGADLEMLYVGIAPNRAASRATLRSRVVGNHIRGRTGQSTLRRSLAALLSESQGWRARWTSRPVLVDDDERRLSTWMGENLRLTWAVSGEPWAIEGAVIEQLTPPLNQADNSGHELYPFVRAARARWRESSKGDRQA